MAQWFHIRHAPARGILSKTTGFIAEAGFTHSLSPARNCTYGCTYCYVPTMRIHGGLQQEDWTHWGQFTTFKSNAAELLGRDLRGSEIIYCSPLVDPYQPAEATERMMPRVLAQLMRRPPAVFTIQTRSPLILQDLGQLRELSALTRLRVSFTLTTDRDEVRRLYEPHCEPLPERLRAMEVLVQNGISTFATLAPILPCNPETFVRLAIAATSNDILADPFHERSGKPRGATTRAEAERISQRHEFQEWHRPAFQAMLIGRMREAASAHGRRFAVGTEAFRWLAQ
ncbi:MAG: hypothetical protein JJE04_09855 [Acidobacteriia bacterium]|nr:hypothetical protein [Terriglobia bacterium]